MMKITLEDVRGMSHKVFIAQPQAEMGRYAMFPAMMNQLWLPPQTMYPPPEIGLYPANGQNQAARNFLKTECEWFWLVNDDQMYGVDLLARLLLHNKDVVTPLCLEKTPPHFPLIYDAPGKDGLHARRVLRRGERGLQRIYSCGGGGMLVHRRVFEKLEDPWWDQRMIRNPDGHMQLMSEDLPFCEKVNDSGFEVWCDFDMAAVHLGTVGFRPVMNPDTGEWLTEISRADGRCYVPAAKHPSGIESTERRIVVPELSVP